MSHLVYCVDPFTGNVGMCHAFNQYNASLSLSPFDTGILRVGMMAPLLVILMKYTVFMSQGFHWMKLLNSVVILLLHSG